MSEQKWLQSHQSSISTSKPLKRKLEEKPLINLSIISQRQRKNFTSIKTVPQDYLLSEKSSQMLMVHRDDKIHRQPFLNLFVRNQERV